MEASRKAAIQAYKERKPNRGIFAIRCQTTGSVWVDSAPDLPAAENRVWFALRMGDRFMDPAIVSEFAAHGRDAFTFEVLEKLDEDVSQLFLRDLLKEKKLHWVNRLSARKLSPV
ncbi:MAG: GIY-YIG nuclease family protein [Acidobacteriia bacterium]|nr:GIY-YIG nuclease family protein [Terriglobia bacterium]